MSKNVDKCTAILQSKMYYKKFFNTTFSFPKMPSFTAFTGLFECKYGEIFVLLSRVICTPRIEVK